MHTYVFHNIQDLAISSVIFPLNYVQSGLYPNMRLCYYLTERFNYGFSMPKLDVCCGCILFNAENNVEKTQLL